MFVAYASMVFMSVVPVVINRVCRIIVASIMFGVEEKSGLLGGSEA